MLTTQQLDSEGVLDHPPSFLLDGLVYEAHVGSQSYGVATEDSDTDIEGICVPDKELVFPHLAGEIPGFGRQKQRFRQYQQQGVASDGSEFDLTIYSLPYFFQKAMNNEPKFLDLLFAPARCIALSSPVSAMIRKDADLFLHKGCWHKFRGFSYQQRNKMQKKDRDESRLYKYGYHAVRLLDQGVQVLRKGTLVLDPPERRERMRAIREGEWTFEEIESYCEEVEALGNDLYDNANMVPHGPPEDEIRDLLLDCLAMHWGDLDGCVVR